MTQVYNPDFNEFKKAIAEFIKTKPGFEDYNFDAATLNILTDILAWNNQQLAWHINMAYSEMFMDTSFLRDTIISHAQLIGYFPRSIRSAQAKLRVQLTGTPNATVLIPKDFQFNAKGTQNQTLRFSANESYTVTLNGAGIGVSDIDVTEGTRKLYKFKIENNKNKYVIPVPNMDLNTLCVKVYESPTATTYFEYQKFDNLFELDSESKVYWIYETLNNSYQIQFGDNNLGFQLPNNYVVQVEYLLSSGATGNGAKGFTANQSLPGITNISVTTLTPGVGGANKESDESIKTRAPLNYAIQNRAVTANDYKILIKGIYDDISAISVWGGEENPIPYYGRTFISIKPISKERLTELEIDTILDYLKTKQVLTNTLEYVHPQIIDVIPTVKVYLKNKQMTQGAITAAIKVGLTAFANKEINDFNSELKYSRMVEAIDDSATPIDYNITTIKLGYTLYPSWNNTRAYDIYFDNALIPGSLISPEVIFQNNLSYIQDDGNGTVCIYRTIQSLPVKIAEIGTINYDTGKVSLVSFAPEFSGAAFLNFVAIPVEYTIKAKNNKLLQIKSENITVVYPNE